MWGGGAIVLNLGQSSPLPVKGLSIPHHISALLIPTDLLWHMDNITTETGPNESLSPPPPAYVWTLSLSLFWQFLSDDLPEASTSTLRMHLAQVISKRPGTATILHHTKSVSWRPGAKPKLCFQTVSFISRLVSSLCVFIGVRPHIFDQITLFWKWQMHPALKIVLCGWKQ